MELVPICMALKHELQIVIVNNDGLVEKLVTEFEFWFTESREICV